VTRQGTLIGTPAYLAPERVAGYPATPASDLYSLGILAYECLAGARPYAGTPTEIALAHGQRALPPLPGHVPPAVAAFVADLTARDPADRPASARLVSAQAASLRDGLTSQRRPRHGVTPSQDPMTATLAADHPATLADMNPVWHERTVRSYLPDPQAEARGWSRRGVFLAVAAASVVAGLIGWGVSSAANPGTGRSPSTPPAAGTSHSALTVSVPQTGLVGQPVSAVVQQLQSLGLRTVIVWQQGGGQSSGGGNYQPSANYQPSGNSQSPGQGTVVSVVPSGPVPVGSVVTITAVQNQCSGDGCKHHDHGSGDNGNGNGGG
jgi:serine/threonine-protein kinase